MEEKRITRARTHNLIMENREKLSISGVEHVSNFNDEVIEVISVQGNITVKGEDLDIKKLNLEDGNLSIGGHIISITYTEKRDTSSKGIGFLGKMFK